MKLSPIMLILAGTLPMIGLAAPDAKGDTPRKSNEEMIKRFDTNRDGTLDEAERAAMRAAMAKKHSEPQKTAESKPSEDDKKISSGDPSISSPVGDNAAAILEAADPNEDLVKKKLARHQAFIMTFDADKDGKLNEAERKAALEAMRLRR